jgi:hypothetical protein
MGRRRAADPCGCWKNGRSWQFKELAEGAFDELQSIADRIANQRGSGSLAAKTRSWRKQPKTDAQIAFARNLHISKQDWETLSKGEIAQLITHTLAMTAIQQVRMETA